MKIPLSKGWAWFALILLSANITSAAESVDRVPRFSVDHMDRSVDPGVDFYKFASGSWIRNNPVPADKSRWSGFEELQERNWRLVRDLLESCAQDSSSKRSKESRLVGDFYRSALDTNRIERLLFRPIWRDLARIDGLRSTREVFKFLGDAHLRDMPGLFGAGVSPDSKNSSRYIFRIAQGGLGLPDRDYYLAEGFAKQREAYLSHIAKMLTLAGETAPRAALLASNIVSFETELARASKPRADLRDPNANYTKLPVNDLKKGYPLLGWDEYFGVLNQPLLTEVVVGQTNFLARLNSLASERPIDHWKAYLKWHRIRSAAPLLHAAAESESFAFYGKLLRGQEQQEPRWQRAARTIDGSIGEALGKLYVEKHFPPSARAQMRELISNIRAVFQDRLKTLDWMSDETRSKALAKFARFTEKIGHPETFRDYSSVRIRAGDFFGNVERANRFESLRRLKRVGREVDRSEWMMTPQTVNAYFSPTMNEIVFPAGILQPPFFDSQMDDAINYGAIGVVIGHEITHGYDDQGRKYDADGNLKDWWTAEDARRFEARAQKLVDQYGSYEALPGLKVNGRLTLGENLADLGGTSIAFEALQRVLAKDPSKRKTIDGFTPEQRFFLSLAQLWRVNWREAELRRRITVDPHSPSQFRGVGPHVNLQEFFDAFGIDANKPMYRPPEVRAKVW